MRAPAVGRLDNVEVGRVNRTLKIGGRKIGMMRCEYKLLSFFLSNVDLALKRDLLAAVWDIATAPARTRWIPTSRSRLGMAPILLSHAHK